MKLGVCSFRLFVFASVVGYGAGDDDPNCNDTEIYLILQGCKDDKYWMRVKETLAHEFELPSTNTRCVATYEEEREAVEDIEKRKGKCSETRIHVVSSLLTTDHCESKEKCFEMSDNYNQTDQARNLGENYLKLLQMSDVFGWFIETGPDFEALGVDPTNKTIQSTVLVPDNFAGGYAIGQEFCRAAASIAPARIVLLHGPQNAPQSDDRIEGFRNGTDATCPDDGHIIVNEYTRLHGDWSTENAATLITPFLIGNSSVNVVVAANDAMALGALVAANVTRGFETPFLLIGFDANNFTKPLLKSGIMIATVDQLPLNGIVHSLRLFFPVPGETSEQDKQSGICTLGERLKPLCKLKDEHFPNSSIIDKAIKRAMDILVNRIPSIITTPTSLRVRDPETLILRQILQGYNPAIAPSIRISKNVTEDQELVKVLAQLDDFQVFQVDSARQSIFGRGTLVLTWTDSRLSWSNIDFPDIEKVRIPDVDAIWRPAVVFSNKVNNANPSSVETIRANVYINGTVEWKLNLKSAEYRCGSIDDTIWHFPFDKHTCGVELELHSEDEVTVAPLSNTSPTDISILDGDWEPCKDTLNQGDSNPSPDLEQKENVSSQVNSTFLGDANDTLNQGDPNSSRAGEQMVNISSQVNFTATVQRDARFVVLGMVVPSYLLNIISFAQFWIPAQSGTINLDRGGLAITTILASLALRASTVSEIDTAFTFLDVFLLLSLSFHFIGFLITAHESSYQRTKRILSESSVDTQGPGDSVGKLILPIVFGIGNMILAWIWNGRDWELFYMGMVTVLGVIALNSKVQRRCREFFSGEESNNTQQPGLDADILVTPAEAQASQTVQQPGPDEDIPVAPGEAQASQADAENQNDNRPQPGDGISTQVHLSGPNKKPAFRRTSTDTALTASTHNMWDNPSTEEFRVRGPRTIPEEVQVSENQAYKPQPDGGLPAQSRHNGPPSTRRLKSTSTGDLTTSSHFDDCTQKTPSLGIMEMGIRQDDNQDHVQRQRQPPLPPPRPFGEYPISSSFLMGEEEKIQPAAGEKTE